MYENFLKKLLELSPFGGDEEEPLLPKPDVMTEAPEIFDTSKQLGLMQRSSDRRAAERERAYEESRVRVANQNIKAYMAAIKAANPPKEYITTGVPKPPTRPDFAATELVQLIDQRESGGDYDALLGHAQKGKFSGIKPSQMTIGELKKFAQEVYGPWSKEYKRRHPQYGSANVMSTPIGRYQFVMTTLLENANKMGLDDNTVFSPEVQDKMFDFEVRKRLNPFSDPADRRKAIRSGWVGLDGVNDRILDYAIQNYLGL